MFLIMNAFYALSLYAQRVHLKTIVIVAAVAYTVALALAATHPLTEYVCPVLLQIVKCVSATNNKLTSNVQFVLHLTI
jgi:hypothetical protein